MMKLCIGLTLTLLLSTSVFAASTENVQPIQIAQPPLSATQLQDILSRLPSTGPALRAGDKAARLAPAPNLTAMRIVQVSAGSTKYENIAEFQSSTTQRFSSAPFDVLVFEDGYGQSYAEYGVARPGSGSDVLLCNKPQWRQCQIGEPAQGFLKTWHINPSGPGQFKTWSISINGGGMFQDRLSIQ